MADSNWGWGNVDDYLRPNGTSTPLADQVLTNPTGTQTAPLPGQQSLTMPTPGFQPAINGMSQADYQRLQAGKQLAINTALGFAIPGGAAADMLGPIEAAASRPRVSIPSATVQHQFVGLPATTPAPDLLGNFMADRTASASYTPPAGTPLSGAPGVGPVSQPGAPMSVPPGAKFTLDNGQKVTTTGMHWIDDSGQTRVQVHHGNANQTQWLPIDKLAGGTAAVAGVAASSKPTQAQPKSGAQVIYDSTTPWYLKSAIGNGDTSYRNPLTLLNPFRDVPDSFYPAQTDLASQDPAYRNRLQTVNNGTVGTAAPFPGTGQTNAPATSGAGANLANFQSWLGQPPPSVYPYLPAWAQRTIAP